MDDPRPDAWTDAEVCAYLTGMASPMEGWWYAESGGYGFCGTDGELFACADDNHSRAQRIAQFLRSIGARTFEQIGPLPPTIARPQ